MRDQTTMPGHLARRFQQIACAAFNAEIAAIGYDLTPVQYSALALVRSHQTIDQVTMANQIAVDPATLTGVIDRLVSKGLLLRTVSATDRRARDLHLTDEGRDLLDIVDPAVTSAQALMTAALTDDETTQLLGLLRKAIGGGPKGKRPTVVDRLAEA